MTRRRLVGSAFAAGLAACGPATSRRLDGAALGGALATRGHLVRQPLATRPGPTRKVDVLVVGAGVAGLSCAWKLARENFRGSVLVVDLDDAVGGTARAGEAGKIPYPWGAHYLTLPSPECSHVVDMLADLGVVTGFEDGRPIFHPRSLCLAPEERLFVRGRFVEGLWPTDLASADDERQRVAFEARCRELTGRVGADGRPAFAIPVAASSLDPSLRALAALDFETWLHQEGFTSPLLREYVDYCCRDDFGVRCGAVSAWAGLHYFCSRRPQPGDARDLGTHVLTWPAGNGWLCAGLRGRFPYPVQLASTVRAVEAGGRAWIERDGHVEGIDAQHVVLAVPEFVAARLLGRAPATTVDYAPWRVAQLHVSELPSSNGVPSAWDTVVHGARGLGYVNAAHQRGDYRGPSVLTYYEPVAHRAELGADWATAAESVLHDLRPAHPDLDAVVTRLDTWAWGHGTAVPAPGVHGLDGAGRPLLDALTATEGRVHHAHTGQSGLSLFEEASFHGVRVATEILA